jgi:hypothetical protein
VNNGNKGRKSLAKNFTNLYELITEIMFNGTAQAVR